VAQAVAAALVDEVPSGTPIWASPARRARATADAIAAAIAAPVEVVDDLAEVDVGRAGGPTGG
jgi:broad specificity phosphatase PhoE